MPPVIWSLAFGRSSNPPGSGKRPQEGKVEVASCPAAHDPSGRVDRVAGNDTVNGLHGNLARELVLGTGGDRRQGRNVRDGDGRGSGSGKACSSAGRRSWWCR